MASSDKPESPTRQSAFATELSAFIERFATEWNINRLEVVGLLFWAATRIVNAQDEEEADGG